MSSSDREKQAIGNASAGSCLDEFDTAWQRSEQLGEPPPEVSRFWKLSNSNDVELLVCLIAIDMERRWVCWHRQGEAETRPTAAWYLQQHPILDASERLRREVIAAEYRACLNARVAVELPELLSRYSGVQGLQPVLLETLREFKAENHFEESLEIPGFKIARELGRGGRGIVFKAWEERLHRYVALKLLHPEFALASQDRHRFLREAEALAKLQHPNVVSVHSILEVDPNLILVMEFIEGESLDRLASDGELPWDRVVDYSIQIGKGIEHAHQAGVLHRDVKPANILVTPDGMAKVSDFGLAKSATTATSATALTATHDIVGTPCYMAPEQIDASLGEMGPPADVYSIGATLYCLLTGRPPLKGSTSWETFQLVLTVDPLPPSKLNPRIPRELETICLKCLEKNPEKRYQSANEVVSELTRFQSGQPIQARPLNVVQRGARWASRSPREASLWALSLLFFAGLLATLVVSNYRLRDAILREQAQLEVARIALGRSESSRYVSRIQQAFLQYESNNLQEMSAVLELAIPKPGELDQRGWEWYYLERLSHPGKYRFEGGYEDSPWIRILAMDRKAEFLLCGTSVPWYESVEQDAQARACVWKLGERQPVFDTLVPGNSIDGLSIDVQQRRIAVAVGQIERSGGRERAFDSKATKLQVYDLSTSELLWETEAVAQNALTPEFSGDNEVLLVLSVSGMTAYRAATGELLWDLEGTKAFRCFDSVVQLEEQPGTWTYRDVRSGDVVPQPDGNPGRTAWVRDFHAFLTETDFERLPTYSLSYDASLSASIVDDRVLIRDRSEASPLVELLANNPAFCCLSPDNNSIAVGLADGAIEIRDVSTGFVSQVLRGHGARISFLQFSADGTHLVSGDWSGEVVVWDLKNSTLDTQFGVQSPGFDEFPVEAFAATSEGEVVMVRSLSPMCQWWESAETKPTAELSLEDEPVHRIAPGICAVLSNDGRYMARTVGEDRTGLAIWDLEVRQRLHTVDGDIPVQFVGMGHAGKQICVARWPRRPAESSGAARVEVYTVQEGKQRFIQQFLGRRIWRVAVHENAELVAIITTTPTQPEASIVDNQSNSLHLFTLEGRKLWEVDLPDSVLCLGLCFEPQGRWLATGTLNGKICMWESKTGLLLNTMEGRLENVENMCVHPNGTRLVAVTRKQLTVWETTYGQKVLALPVRIASFDPIFNPQVRFFADGRGMLLNQFDETVRMLDASPRSP